MNPVIEPLGNHHDRAAFSCGEESLDAYLKTRAGQDQRRNVARVFAAVDPDTAAIIGYYSISSFALVAGELPDEIARRLPRYDRIPAALVGRLAIDTRYQGQGFGAVLLVDAIKRIIESGETIGIFAIVVDALNDDAAVFYEKYGFKRFPDCPNRLFLPMQTAIRAFL